EKINVLCEDIMTERWCKNLLNGTKMKKNLAIKKVPIGANILKELAQKNHPAFKKMIFVLDGDQRTKTNENLPRTLFLPGNTSPEKVFYKFLFSLDELDDYWDNDNLFSKQVCFNQYLNSHINYKTWFEKKCDNQSHRLSTLLNKWKRDNPKEVKNFKNKFKKALSSINT
ncbi:hypothetical protein K8R43_00615, partial [archaeon]|nr:hypothetical protein [archaeon]